MPGLVGELVAGELCPVPHCNFTTLRHRAKFIEPGNLVGRKFARGAGHSTSADLNRMPASTVQARNCANQYRSPPIVIGRPFSRSGTVCQDVPSYPGAVVLGDGSRCRRSDCDLSAFKLPVPVCARYFVSVPAERLRSAHGPAVRAGSRDSIRSSRSYLKASSYDNGRRFSHRSESV
jgi:hypothetical protein